MRECVCVLDTTAVYFKYNHEQGKMKVGTCTAGQESTCKQMCSEKFDKKYDFDGCTTDHLCICSAPITLASIVLATVLAVVVSAMF